MNQRIKIFNDCLREIVKPNLGNLGFKFDNSRTFRRIRDNAIEAEIINFQLGLRSLEGKYTVNLGVYQLNDNNTTKLEKALPHDCNCEAESRIGALIPPKIEFLKNTPVLGYFFGSPDKWWKFSNDHVSTRTNLEIVNKYIIRFGIPWLQNTKP